MAHKEERQKWQIARQFYVHYVLSLQQSVSLGKSDFDILI